MNAIRMLALDLDGTLTNSEKRVSARNRRAIRLAQEKGVVVVLASGRPVLGIQPVADELGLKETGGYILSSNGSRIVDCSTGEDVVRVTVPMKYVPIICETSRRYPVAVLTYDEVGIITEDDRSPYVHREATNNRIPIRRVNRLENAVLEPVVKFMVVGEPDRLNKAAAWLQEQLAGKLNVFFSEEYFLEVTPLGIEKAEALRGMLERFGWTSENLMACGDSYNDIPMLKYAGLSVCMANGCDDAKACSDHVVGSNDEDGVAEAVERFILSET